MIYLPIPSNAAKFSFSINLDGTVYRLTFTFNTRQLSWSFVFAEQDGTPILSGVKILPSVEFLYRHADERLPDGMLWAIDPKNLDKGERPTRNSLSSHAIRLMYITAAEVELLRDTTGLTVEDWADAVI